jgi:threonine dehydrogenase-like Zn-dependent dehydrogenase
MRQLFNNNIGVVGGVAPVRNYLDELLPEVVEGRLDPGAVFDYEVALPQTAEAYAAMDERRSIKTLIRP